MWRLTNIMAARKQMEKGHGYAREKFLFALVLTALQGTQGL